jgi:hypothetical protein
MVLDWQRAAWPWSWTSANALPASSVLCVIGGVLARTLRLVATSIDDLHVVAPVVLTACAWFSLACTVQRAAAM